MKIDLLDRPRLELLNKRGLRYNLHDAEKDYFLAITLMLLYDSELKNALVFKGGTAIYHCYLEQLRFSKNLDFTAISSIKLSSIENFINNIEIFNLKNFNEKKYSLDFSIQYQGLLGQPDTIQININTNQKVLTKPNFLEYKNNYGLNFSCFVMDKNEIFAEKIRTLVDRARPRDSYDLFILKKNFGVKIKDALEILGKKELHNPLDIKLIEENLKISIDRFDDEMRELYYRQSVKKDDIETFAHELLSYLKK